jgi:hypothetical protein
LEHDMTRTRTVRLAADGTALVIRQQQGKQAIQTDTYFLTRTAEGWTLSKHDGTKYEVRGNTCNCPGHRHYHHCKHVESLAALQQAGKLKEE